MLYHSHIIQIINICVLILNYNSNYTSTNTISINTTNTTKGRKGVVEDILYESVEL